MKREIGHCEYYGPDFNFECLEAAHINAYANADEDVRRLKNAKHVKICEEELISF